MRIFYRFDGNNGATFFLNASSAEAWRKSIDFYRPVTVKAQMKRRLLLALRPFVRLYKAKLWSAEECLQACAMSIPRLPGHLFSWDSSAMISPTRDKLIVHRHGFGFYKCAARNSFTGVVREIKIYELLATKQLEHFCISKVTEEVLDFKSETACFFMAYGQDGEAAFLPSLTNIRIALSEFFSASPPKKITWDYCWKNLARRANTVLPDLAGIIEGQSRLGCVPCGLTHRDFKPWNIKNAAQLQFFDFEETVTDGLPLEDFFNFVIDPLVRYKPPELVFKRIEDLDFQTEMGHFLASVGTNTDWRIFWRWYLLERQVFWAEKNALDTALCYRRLYDFSIQQEY